MEIFIAALIFVGSAVLIMNFNLLFRKGKSFPDSEIGHNKELRKKGLICAKESELRLWKKKNRKNGKEYKDEESNSCLGCGEGCFDEITNKD